MRIARDAINENPEGIIIMGGDGSIFDVINSIHDSSVPLLFVPCGTGNDFVRSLKLPKNPVEALAVQLDMPIRRIDIGKMNDLYFVNVSGTGFDVDVLRHAEQYKIKYNGLRPYLRGLIDALKQYKPMTVMVSYDDEPEECVRSAIISVGNGRFFGGGMQAVPTAIVDDGMFDVITVKPLNKLMITLMLVFFITGNHVKLHIGSMRRCRKFSIRGTDMTVNLDGELRQTNEANYEIISAALCVRVPR